MLTSDLGSRQKITAIGTLATPVLEYSFGIIKGRLEKIRELARKTVKLFNMHGGFHPRAELDRLYVPPKNSGRGLRQMEASHVLALYRTAHYVAKSA